MLTAWDQENQFVLCVEGKRLCAKTPMFTSQWQTHLSCASYLFRRSLTVPFLPLSQAQLCRGAAQFPARHLCYLKNAGPGEPCQKPSRMQHQRQKQDSPRLSFAGTRWGLCKSDRRP